jgi:hypothetical protein
MRGFNITKAPILHEDGDSMISVPWDHPLDEGHWVENALNRDKKKFGQHVRKGLYAPQIRRWFQNYPRHSILVIDYRELQRNTSEVYFRILDFAGVPRGTPRHSFEKKKPGGHDFPPMANATRAYLESFYAPYNAQLEELLGEEWKGAWTSEW